MPRTAGRIADELHDLLQRAQVAMPRVLVGHSYGGLVVRLLAAHHPRTVAGLVLIEPADPDQWMQPSDEQRRQIARGARLCRYGAQATRLGIGKAIAALVGIGALGAARAVVNIVSRGALARADEHVLAPVWKLPPETRRLLKEMWTQPKFFKALGSQIESIGQSACEVAREAPSHYGDLPLVVVTAAGADEARMQTDAALARRSDRGRHVVVADTGHWIPIDAPDAVVKVVVDLVGEIRASRSG
jgi:pimeloyl-ACP methyl ester carboxylesterase